MPKVSQKPTKRCGKKKEKSSTAGSTSSDEKQAKKGHSKMIKKVNTGKKLVASKGKA